MFYLPFLSSLLVRMVCPVLSHDVHCSYCTSRPLWSWRPWRIYSSPTWMKSPRGTLSFARNTWESGTLLGVIGECQVCVCVCRGMYDCTTWIMLIGLSKHVQGDRYCGGIQKGDKIPVQVFCGAGRYRYRFESNSPACLIKDCFLLKK